MGHKHRGTDLQIIACKHPGDRLPPRHVQRKIYDTHADQAHIFRPTKELRVLVSSRAHRCKFLGLPRYHDCLHICLLAEGENLEPPHFRTMYIDEWFYHCYISNQSDFGLHYLNTPDYRDF